jgi:hypothetical protein
MGKKTKKSKKSLEESDCVIPEHPVPARELSKYGVDHDPHSESGIADYVHGQAPDETVQHVERVKYEVVLGDKYEIWDVVTDKDRWWVITNLTNLYSQRHFPSLDYTLSFHIGLMMRLRSKPHGVQEPSPFDEVFRRQQQAKDRHDTAIEAEDYQTVGMHLRECLLSLIGVLRHRVTIPPGIARPQDSNFIDWCDVLMNQIYGGRSNKELRQHLKSLAKDTWQLANWLTHYRKATANVSSIAIHSCDTVVSHFVTSLMKDRIGGGDKCPLCNSRNIRTHYDTSIKPNGDYYMTCGVCEWSNHPKKGSA